ncbi:osmoprotectant ABC transporter substrate-binding protein [Enterococcus lemanii]|jgi:osmoprotectant transport system substrate-binding protein|uniref:Osmoprotectant ABC transporter substrate-binding protein n=1 Tax=Enterococcus lemanii TaxID=1159752 RepID=A0ABV9MUT3_9ENTE|nr:osmoprotectant ABC transporter substrate-binding protein [Enterococcus lemanii]MBM7709524.1 osmoprotectant transport system substrate-binding protein [Enterococcus lemanii]
MRKIKTSLIVLGTLFFLSACSLPGLKTSRNANTIAITGGITTEAQILGSIVAEMIEHYTDKETTIINNLGTTNINHQAMLNGDAQISAARYTGTDVASTLQLDPITDPKAAFDTVKREFASRFDQTWFPSYGFENSYVFLVREDTAKKFNLKTVSDLADVADQLVIGADRAWMTREGDGYPGFTKAYGFSFASILPMQIGLVYDAVATGHMDVVLGYSTDGRITSNQLVMLEDDRHFFPPYDASPVATNAILEQVPELTEIFARLEKTIDTTTMQQLNAKADNELLEPSIVAKQFLEVHDYFEGGTTK